MIMSCLANRVRKGWGSWLEILDSIPKYAAITDVPTGTPAIWEPQFIHLLHDVEAIFDSTQDYAKGATYWCDTRYVTTPFFVSKILSNPTDHPRVAEMNTLVCFK